MVLRVTVVTVVTVISPHLCSGGARPGSRGRAPPPHGTLPRIVVAQVV